RNRLQLGRCWPVCGAGRAQLRPLSCVGICAVLGDLLAVRLSCGRSDLLRDRPADRPLRRAMLAFTQTVEREWQSPATAALDIEGLRVEFPTVASQPKVAIRDLDLSIRPGEILGLVGESGAGKTTLARSILNLPPSPGRIATGTVRFRGVDLL